MLLRQSVSSAAQQLLCMRWSTVMRQLLFRLMTHPPSLYKSLSISKVIHNIVVFYSYLLKLTEWLMLAISGIESTTCFKNMPMQRTIPENITAAKAIVKIVIIIINLFKIYYLLFLKCECKVNTFLSNNGIFCREISLQYVFLDMGQPLVLSL